MKKIGILIAAAFVVATGANAADSDRKPVLAFSSATERDGRLYEGPLYKKVESDFKAVASGKASFSALLAKGAVARYSTDISQGPSSMKPLTGDTIKAMLGSCVGPFSFDEGPSWVQLSWVCRIKAPTTLSKTVIFRNSPEMGFTVWFQDGLIKEIQAMEPLPWPGAKRYVMGAVDDMQEAR